jgi:ArsR family transcriptional regulator
MDESDAVLSLAALAQATRLRGFRALVQAGPQGLTPTDLAEHLQAPPATLSFHLKELHRAGLITQERDGRHLIYRADFRHMNALLAYLTEHCCEGVPCDVTANPTIKCTTC